MKTFPPYLLCLTLGFAAIAAATDTSMPASTAAYWRFESPGPAGAAVPHTGTGGNFDGQLADSSGNGHLLSAWAQGGATGETFSSSVPSSVIPQNGLSNTLSLLNGGSWPGLFTDAGDSINEVAFAKWTVETFFYATSLTGSRVLVGKDGENVAVGAPGTSPFTLYASRSGDGKPAVVFVDRDGITNSAVSTTVVTAGKWYHLAAVSDGAFLWLYLDSLTGAGPQMVATTALDGGNNAMSVGAADNDRWSIFRGMKDNAHVDRFAGYIDEVRISSAALVQAQFLSVTGTGSNDLDADGLPDDWETNRFGGIALQDAAGDPDGDGADNFAEFAFDGDPASPRSTGPRLSSYADSNLNGCRDFNLTLVVRAGAVFTRDPVDHSQTATVEGITYKVRGSLDMMVFSSSVNWVGKTVSPHAGYEVHTFLLALSDLPFPSPTGFLQAVARRP